MSRVSNGNLIVLKWQDIHMISNIKYSDRERERKRKRLRDREREKERDREIERERDRERERERAKPGQAVYFTFNRGIFRTLSNI